MNHHDFDYNQLRREAQIRWLKPPEILYILQNYERFPITEEPPQRPPSGSFFLFNRRVLRFFRRDGHTWRKKRDGRAVGEAHERLKVGNVDTLNCYYAHGDPNPYFQRRSYWMLDPAFDHIVLVHYREVSEGRFLPGSSSNMSTGSCSTFNQSNGVSNANYQGRPSGTSELCEPNGSSCSPGSVEEVSSEFATEKSETDHFNAINRSGNSELPSQPVVNQALRKLAEQLSLDDDDNTIYFGGKLPAYCNEHERSQDLGLQDYETRDSLQESHDNILHGSDFWGNNQIEPGKQYEDNIHVPNVSGGITEEGGQSLVSGCSTERSACPSWNEVFELSSRSAATNAHGRTSSLLVPQGAPGGSNALGTHFPSRGMLQHEGLLYSSEREKSSLISFGQAEQITWQQLDHGGNHEENSYRSPESELSLQLSAASRFLLGHDNPMDSPTTNSHLPEVGTQHNSGTSTCDANCNVMEVRKQNSTDWMGTTDLALVNNTYSSEFSGMWFDQGQLSVPVGADLSLTLAQKQLFSIHEISPEWGFAFESTKVIIIGQFLCNRSECPWAVMFGNVEVPVEIVQEGVFRCQAPQLEAGKVTLCITSDNRESCSEIREFEFRAKPTSTSLIDKSPQADATRSAEELLLLARLVHMLLYGMDCLTTLKGGIGTETAHSPKSKAAEERWSQITEALVGNEVPPGSVDWIMQELLKDKLQHWLSSKYQGNEGRGYFLSKQEQGIIHLISGLGYEWALSPILDSDVGVNFRDANGWTALHWAAHFGREEMVAALLAAGASAGAVTDPTPQDPVGKTAGAIAAASGHRGLAGYLSEADLTSLLSSLTVEENEISKGSAEVEAQKAVESISQRSVQMYVGGTEEELSLKDSLAAVRNTAQAAARIQAAFRAHSFRTRQQKAAMSCHDCDNEYYGLTPEDIQGISASSKFQRTFHGLRDQKLDKAALSIQKKYRGWKGRKDFLTLRHNVVKIQAHVRGHQERKKYKEFVWTVSVVEKVILRWRRRGVGLRGFRAEPELIDDAEEEEDIAKVFRKQKVNVAIEQAVSRVLSMVESPTARQQYRRMLERYRQAKAESSTTDEATSSLGDNFEITEKDEFMY